MKLILSIVLAFLAISWAENVCNWEYTDPISSKVYKFNYNKLSRTSNFYTGYETPTRNYMYIMNPCGVVTNITQCNQNNATLCQVDQITGGFVANVASWQKAGTPDAVWSIMNPNNPALGAQMKFVNGDVCYIFGVQRQRTAYMQFVCGPQNSSVPNAFNVTEDDSTCTFVTLLQSPSACSGSSGGGGGGDSDELSGGSIFIIILVVVIPVYIIVGCIYKWRVNGTSGIESCPNIEFWRDLPHLVKDGFSYTMSGCKKGSDSHYDEL
jgi:hypothetical protein